MTDLERMLAELAVDPPTDLADRTSYDASALDHVTRADSPIGGVWVAWSVRGLTAVSPLFESHDVEEFAQRHRRPVVEHDRLPRDLWDAVELGLESGETLGLPIDLRGLRPFQSSVLEACATIPVGSVRPYGWIADEIGNPGSVRAVGTALGRNPIPLLVPCHRVVKSDGSVGSYAFGAETKRRLLAREGAILV
jgi:O-6-methylguanine DNA methyltransferase